MAKIEFRSVYDQTILFESIFPVLFTPETVDLSPLLWQSTCPHSCDSWLVTTSEIIDLSPLLWQSTCHSCDSRLVTPVSVDLSTLLTVNLWPVTWQLTCLHSCDSQLVTTPVTVDLSPLLWQSTCHSCDSLLVTPVTVDMPKNPQEFVTTRAILPKDLVTAGATVRARLSTVSTVSWPGLVASPQHSHCSRLSWQFRLPLRPYPHSLKESGCYLTAWLSCDVMWWGLSPLHRLLCGSEDRLWGLSLP